MNEILYQIFYFLPGEEKHIIIYVFLGIITLILLTIAIYLKNDEVTKRQSDILLIFVCLPIINYGFITDPTMELKDNLIGAAIANAIVLLNHFFYFRNIEIKKSKK